MRPELSKLTECQVESSSLEYGLLIRLLLKTKHKPDTILKLKKENFNNGFIKLGGETLDCSLLLDNQKLEAFKSHCAGLLPDEFIFDSSSSRFGLKNAFLSYAKRLSRETDETYERNSEGGPPHALLIGFPKCGTTWLYEMCRRFPTLDAPQKEICFFSTAHFCKGSSWYENHFRPGERLSIDISPDYAFSSLSLDRIRNYQLQINRPMKFLVFLRQPSDQIRSAINHRRKGGRGWLDLDAYVNSGNVLSHFVERANYFERIAEAKQKLGAENFLLIFQEDISANPKSAFMKILRFLDAKRDFTEIENASEASFRQQVNKGKPVINFGLLRTLTDLDLFNRRLFGRSLFRKALSKFLNTCVQLFCIRKGPYEQNEGLEKMLRSEKIVALDATYLNLKEQETNPIQITLETSNSL